MGNKIDTNTNIGNTDMNVTVPTRKVTGIGNNNVLFENLGSVDFNTANGIKIGGQNKYPVILKSGSTDSGRLAMLPTSDNGSEYYLLHSINNIKADEYGRVMLRMENILTAYGGVVAAPVSNSVPTYNSGSDKWDLKPVVEEGYLTNSNIFTSLDGGISSFTINNPNKDIKYTKVGKTVTLFGVVTFNKTSTTTSAISIKIPYGDNFGPDLIVGYGYSVRGGVKTYNVDMGNSAYTVGPTNTTIVISLAFTLTGTFAIVFNITYALK